jgi:hypothetical protein
MTAWIALGLLVLALVAMLARSASRRYWNWRIREHRYRRAKEEVKGWPRK